MPTGVLLIMGLTASGKTELALELATRFDAEIIGADSRQVYRGMPIGTAAPSAEQHARVRHHLIGFLDPHERYSAARFVTDALAAIDDIHARGKRAIVVGGTGFYLRALTGDVALSAVRDDALRERLAREVRVHPTDVLHAWLAALAPTRAASLTVNDPYRITRALEIALALRGGSSAEASSERPSPDSLRGRGLPYRKLGLAIDDDVLRTRIDARVDAMLVAGLLDEAERIGPDAVAADAVGYREALDYLAGFTTREEMRTALRRMTRRYAKRQATWFRREPEVAWITAGDDTALAAIVASLPGWEAAAEAARVSGA
jgi:tRNA dimethylallyltransferase